MAIDWEQHYRDEVRKLVLRALHHGIIVTVTPEPRKPLAMGNIDLVVEARPSLRTIREQMQKP